MIKKTTVFALVLSILLLLLIPELVHAQSDLRVLNSSVEAEFPVKLYFNLSAESDANINDVRLHYIVEQESYAQVTSEIYTTFVPDTTIDVQWALDMRKTGGFPPESLVEYWWTVEDAEGNTVTTAPAIFHFNDNRFVWQRLTEGEIAVYWYEGEQSFADEIMLTAQQALERLAQSTGAYLSQPVKLFIYANSQDLQSGMIFPQEWTGGAAYQRHGIIAIGISPDNILWGRRAITHELTHLVVYQMTFNPYNWLPKWLDEGLAMYNEGLVDPYFIQLLEEAIAEDTLFTVRSLSSPFSTYAEESYLSYAQSYSLVEYLITSYGQDKMFELLNTFKEGSNYDAALKKVYGFDMDDLNDLWRDYVAGRYQEAEVPITEVLPTEQDTIPIQQIEESRIHPALAGVLAALATSLLLILSLFAESWTWRRVQ